jgi:hypothetical protein
MLERRTENTHLELLMAKRVVRPYDPKQLLPMPTDLRQWLPTDHTVYLLGDIIDQLDLSPITAVYDQGDGGGPPEADPTIQSCSPSSCSTPTPRASSPLG